MITCDDCRWKEYKISYIDYTNRERIHVMECSLISICNLKTDLILLKNCPCIECIVMATCTQICKKNIDYAMKASKQFLEF